MEIDLRPIVRFTNIKIGDITRPSGEVDILIGYDYAGWHPIPELVCQYLVVLSNILWKMRRCPFITYNTEKKLH